MDIPSTASGLWLALAAGLTDTGALELFLAVLGGDQSAENDENNEETSDDSKRCKSARRIAICLLHSAPELAAHVLHGATVLEGKTFEVEEFLVLKHGHLNLSREVLVLFHEFPKSKLLVFLTLH